MFERSEFPAVPLAGCDGRASARSADARQGVLCFGYFHLDKQMKVTRAAARNPKLKFAPALVPNTRARPIRLSALTSLPNPRFRTAVRLPFVCSSERKEAKKKTPGLRVGAKRAEPLRCSVRRVRQKLRRLSPPSNTLPHRRSAPGTLRPCASRSLHTGSIQATNP